MAQSHGGTGIRKPYAVKFEDKPVNGFFHYILFFFWILYKVLMTEAYTAVENVMKYYGKIENGKVVDFAAQIPFNFILTDSDITTTAFDFKKLINTYIIYDIWAICRKANRHWSRSIVSDWKS